MHGDLLTLFVSDIFPPRHSFLLHQVWSALTSLRGGQLCWERQRRCGEVQGTEHSKDQHSLLFYHTYQGAMIMEPNAEQWISATGFQLGDVWGRVSRIQCSLLSARVVSSAFLLSALQSAKDRAKLTQKLIISEFFFVISTVETYTVTFLW